MQYDKKRLQWIEFDLLEGMPDISHAVFSRHGGVSQKHFSSLNFSNSVGDDPEHVKVNREQAKNFLEANHLVFANQVHGSEIVEISLGNEDHVPQADGLFTKLKGVGLAITHADCQAAIFYDPKTAVIAVAHAGWRGLVENIYGKMVQTLEGVGCRPEDLLVGISPSLGPCHAEFVNYEKEFPKSFWSFQVKPNYFDLRAIGKSQLLEAKVPEKNIEVSDICTYDTEEDYFSFRREKDTGRNATVIALKPERNFK